MARDRHARCDAAAADRRGGLGLQHLPGPPAQQRPRRQASGSGTRCSPRRYSVKIGEARFRGGSGRPLRKLREEGRASNLTAQAEAERKRRSPDDLKRAGGRSGLQSCRDYTFKNLFVDRSEGQWLTLPLKPETPTGVDDLEIPIIWQAGNGDEFATLTHAPHEFTLICGRFTNDSHPGPLRRLARRPPSAHREHGRENSVTFQGDDSFTMFYDLGTFHWNLSGLWPWSGAGWRFWRARAAGVDVPVVHLSGGVHGHVPGAARGDRLEVSGRGDRCGRPAPNGDDPLYWFGPCCGRWALYSFGSFRIFPAMIRWGMSPAGRSYPSCGCYVAGLPARAPQGTRRSGVIGGVVLTKRELAQVTV